MNGELEIGRSPLRVAAVLALLLALAAALLGYCQYRSRVAKAPITRLDGLSPAQKEIVGVLGYPKSFILAYLPQAGDKGKRLVRLEVWFYPEHQKKITFLAGRIYDFRNPYDADFWAQVGGAARTSGSMQFLGRPDFLNYPDLRPQDFDFSMDYARVIESVGRSATPIDFANSVFAGSLKSYLAGQVFFSLDRGKLTYVQTMGADKEPASVSLQSSPGKAINFLADVPERLHQPLGAVAPIGQTWLIAKPPSRAAKIFADARAASLAHGGGQRQLEEVEQAYRNEAATLRSEAEQLRAGRRRLQSETMAAPATWEDYQKRIIDIDGVVGSLETAALTLDRGAARLGRADLVRLFGGSAAESLRTDAEDLVAHNPKKELAILTSPTKAMDFLRTGGMDARKAVEQILMDDAAAFLKTEGFEPGAAFDSLQEELAQRLREELEDDRESLRDNWLAGLEEILRELRPTSTGAGKARQKPRAPKIRLTAWVDELLAVVRGRPKSEPQPSPAPKSGTAKLRLRPSKSNADEIKLINYEALIHVAEDGSIAAAYRIEYQLPGSGANVLTFTQDARLFPNIYASMYAKGWPRQVSLSANTHVKSTENGRVYAEEDKVEEDAMTGVLVSPTSGSGKLKITPSLSLDWQVE